MIFFKHAAERIIDFLSYFEIFLFSQNIHLYFTLKIYSFNFSKEMTPFPVKDIFVYHHYWEMYQYNLTFQMMLDANPPPELHYYKCKPECKLCWKLISK